MDNTTIYHNPRCSKSRETLRLIEGLGITPVIIEYLNTPPSAEELGQLLSMLGCEPDAIVRKKESVYRDLGFHENPPTRDELISAMVQYPILIERPIVVRAGKAVVGRPPEQVRTLF